MDNSAVLGSSDAPIEIHMFQDLKCGMCKYAFNNLIPELQRGYVEDGRARIIFHEFPLGFSRKEARFAHAARCALRQGRYYEYLNYLYQNLKTTDMGQVQSYATQLGLDQADFEKCLNDSAVERQLRRDYNIGMNLKIEGTPYFFVNGRQIAGARPYDEVAAVIDQELANKSGAGS